MNRVICLVLALVLLSLPGSLFAAGDVASLLDKIQSAYRQIDTFEAKFEQTLKHRESGSTEKRKGSLLFQRPCNIRWETAKPNPETLVVNSREVWNYLPDEEIAYRYGPEVIQDSRTIIQVLTGQAKLNKDFDVKRAGTDNGMVKLEIFPKEPTPQMIDGLIWVDPASGAIQRARITDFYGNTNEVAFTSFKPGIKPAAGKFVFKAPKGVDVEDRIQKAVKETPL